MAKVTRDTALRSLQDLFRDLPADAVIELAKDRIPPRRRGAPLTVTVTINEPAPKAKPPEAPTKAPEAGSDDEAVQGQQGPRVAGGGKRRGGKKGKGPDGH